jgi:hypothetical protein
MTQMSWKERSTNDLSLSTDRKTQNFFLFVGNLKNENFKFGKKSRLFFCCVMRIAFTGEGKFEGVFWTFIEDPESRFCIYFSTPNVLVLFYF